jgi:hypothetical protein
MSVEQAETRYSWRNTRAVKTNATHCELPKVMMIMLSQKRHEEVNNKQNTNTEINTRT